MEQLPRRILQERVVPFSKDATLRMIAFRFARRELTKAFNTALQPLPMEQPLPAACALS